MLFVRNWILMASRRTAVWIGLGVFFCMAPMATVLGQSLATIRINEVMAANQSFPGADGAATDWVELHNSGTTAVSLAGARLTDNAVVPGRWVFPAGVSIPPGGFLVVALDSSKPASIVAEANLNAGFSLKSVGDSIYLHASGTGGLVDSVEFGFQIADMTLGRVPDGSSTWRLCSPSRNSANLAATLAATPGNLKLNEWMAAPSEGEDWVEIINIASAPISLAGIRLSDDPSKPDKYLFPAYSFLGTGPKAYLIIWADDNIALGKDHAAFKLSASGEALILTMGASSVDVVTFGAQQSGVSQGRFPDGAAAIVQFPNSVSMGESNYRLHPSIHINEVLSHADPPLEDALELFNSSTSAISIGGWFLSDSKSNPRRFQIPQGVSIPAGGYKVFYANEFNGAGATDPFSFDSVYGDNAYLFEADASGTLTGVRAEQKFGPAANGVSFGRVSTRTPGVFQFVPLRQRTFGKDNPTSLAEFRTGTGLPNSLPLIPPVVVSEIHYQPPLLGGVDNTSDEFVELFNTSFETQPLFDLNYPENRWRLSNGITFTFPANTWIRARGHALVVPFDPVLSPGTAAAFRNAFSVPPAVPLYGPFEGKLSNSGESIELERPDPPQLPPQPDAGYVPYVLLERVDYLDTAPWPLSANGDGDSIQRLDYASLANDAPNWVGAPPTPGRGPTAGPDADSDGDGMPDAWELSHQLAPQNPADSQTDSDGDGLTNHQEYLAGTNPRLASSRLMIGVSRLDGLANKVVVRFQAAANRPHRLERREGLGSAAQWTILRVFPAEALDRLVEVLEEAPPGSAPVFYRVAVAGSN